MFKKWVALLVIALTLIPLNVASAQGSPAQQVSQLLGQQGYAVLAVDNFPDAQGNPRPDVMYVMMNAVNSNLDSQEVVLQAVWGFGALRKYYPDASTLLSVLKDRQFLVMFGTDSATFDQFIGEQISAQSFWSNVRSNVKIFNTQTNQMVSEKEFVGGGQTNKSFTQQNFTPQQPACSPPAGMARLYIQSNYMGKTMRFTIGGGEWGTHDYDVPGDAQRHFIDIPPGTYTYTAFIPGEGTAHGERKAYDAGKCYSLTFAPQ